MPPFAALEMRVVVDQVVIAVHVKEDAVISRTAYVIEGNGTATAIRIDAFICRSTYGIVADRIEGRIKVQENATISWVSDHVSEIRWLVPFE